MERINQAVNKTWKATCKLRHTLRHKKIPTNLIRKILNKLKKTQRANN